ncbi:MAG: HigA family addiction module antidote protein [Planctomycetes bacterium]|nr:HigA family addiction module antidote protein [Planctomycetota bacterium]
MKKMLRKPTPPGEILLEEFLKPLRLTQRQLAGHLGCDVKVINRIVNGRSSVTAEMAVRLAAALGTTPEFWLNAQQAVDLYRATRRAGTLPDAIAHAG